jgi:hypothetical protein
MNVRNRIVSLVMGLGVSGAASLVAMPLLAQEPAAARPGEVKAPAARRPVDPSRRVPDFFGQLGLSQPQREEIYKIRARHQQKLDELHKQIIQEQADMLSECEALLTDTQKQLLAQRRQASASARARKLKTPAERPAATKTSEKAGG